MAHVQEHELLVNEQLIVSLLLRKAARMGDGTPKSVIDWPAIRATHERNIKRIAELEGRKINKIVFAARAALLASPHWISRPARSAARALLNPFLNRRLPSAAARASRLKPSAVPFSRDLPAPTLSDRVGVVMHIFYPELAREMRLYLDNIPGAVDLYISTDTEAKQTLLAQAFAGWTAGEVDIRLAPNRGRDIAPKLITFRDVYDRHPVALHLHSKKSPHESHLRMWRYFLFENLMGEREIAAGILAAFEQDQSLGVVASDHYFPVSNAIGWGENYEIAQTLAGRMGTPIDPEAPVDFPSGSMFWARSAALKPLLDLGLSAEDFGPEAGQMDGTLAHAIERLYFVACEQAGLRWMKIGRFEFMRPTDRRVSSVGETANLALR
jgi:hypothetical protein